MERKNLCRYILLQELALRKEKNPSYSLRAFARDLGIGSTSLSDVLASKRLLSPKNIDKISSKLAISPVTREQLHLERLNKPQSPLPAVQQRIQLEEDTFRLIADWYYLAILNLAKIKNNQANPRWVANRLGISKSEAETAIERLVRMGFLSIDKGKLTRTTLPLSTTRDIPSAAVKKHHLDNLKLAAKSLENDAINEREFSGQTMAIDPRKLPEAKDLIMETKRKIAEICESDDPTEVYVLSYQLFPLTKKGEI